MKKAGRGKKAGTLSKAALDALIEEITVDAYGEDEQLWAFRQAFEDSVSLPCGGACRLPGFHLKPNQRS